jgi:hypothetical protein
MRIFGAHDQRSWLLPTSHSHFEPPLQTWEIANGPSTKGSSPMQWLNHCSMLRSSVLKVRTKRLRLIRRSIPVEEARRNFPQDRQCHPYQTERRKGSLSSRSVANAIITRFAHGVVAESIVGIEFRMIRIKTSPKQTSDTADYMILLDKSSKWDVTTKLNARYVVNDLRLRFVRTSVLRYPDSKRCRR